MTFLKSSLLRFHREAVKDLGVAEVFHGDRPNAGIEIHRHGIPVMPIGKPSVLIPALAGFRVSEPFVLQQPVLAVGQ